MKWRSDFSDNSVEVNTLVRSIVVELLVVKWYLPGEDLSVDGLAIDRWSDESVPCLDVWWLELPASPPDPEGVVLAEERPEKVEWHEHLHECDEPE